ncbi:MAG: GspE/PulE family protein [Patescibacteria group bacterium]
MAKDTQSIEDLMDGAADATDDQSAQAKFSQKQQEIKLKETERATEKKAAGLSLPYINLVGFSVSVEAIALIEENLAKELSAICFYYDGKRIKIASTGPANVALKNMIEEFKNKYHSEIKLYICSEHSFNHAMKLYKMVPKTREDIKGIKIEQKDLDKYSEQFTSFKDLQNQISKIETTDIVTLIMSAAVKSGCSDVHIEAEENEIKVRFRVDGILHDVAVLEKELWKKIISRYKVLAGVKINISDKPQDGRFSIFTKAGRLDIRASFLPTNFGESVALRLLRPSDTGLNFEDLGLKEDAFKILKQQIERPNGMVVTTGPTGSGKTTTLYAILKKLNNQGTKIITIEDPIEYQLEGINQSQASEKYGFAQALRSIIRQDPDIIMIGEIRDLETAEIAIQAALTGHLVLSTIHTNDAAGAIPRFLSMGTKPFLLAPAINAIIGQRLVRRLCQKCKQEEKVDENLQKDVIEALNELPEENKQKLDLNNLKFYNSRGCPACQEIGYKGRIGIFEILIMNSEFEKIIISGKISEYDIREIAEKQGMITMVQDGLLKALKGLTSVEEIFRVASQK